MSTFLALLSEKPLEVGEHGVQVVQVLLEEGLATHFEVPVYCLFELLHLVGLVCLDPVLLGFDVFLALLGVDLVKPLLHLS